MCSMYRPRSVLIVIHCWNNRVIHLLRKKQGSVIRGNYNLHKLSKPNDQHKYQTSLTQGIVQMKQDENLRNT